MRSSGSVTDRPWGSTLAKLGIGGFTGLLTVVADGKEYSISFDVGRVVGAMSPLASDAAVRVALTNHLVSSSQVAEINRKIAAAKDRDEIEVLAELAQLSPPHVDRLRNKIVAQRAARTFSLDQATYSADERIAMPAGSDLDVREVIYLGARMNLTEQRLTAALRNFGIVFVIKPEALPTLDQYGFTTDEDPVVHRLLSGASLPELEAAHRDVDPRMIQAILYALMSCDACHVQRTPVEGSAAVEYTDAPEVAPRTSTTDGAYFVSRTQTAPVGARPATNPGTLELELELDPEPEPVPLTFAPAVARTATSERSSMRAPSAPPALDFSDIELPSSTPAPRLPRGLTNAGARSPAAPPVDDGVSRVPPRRSPTDSPMTGGRTPTPGRTSPDTGVRRPSAPPIDDGVPRIPPRGSATSDPGRQRPETLDPLGAVEVTSSPDMSDATGFRSNDPPPPRTVTPRPGAGSSAVRAPGQPTIPRASRGSASPTAARTKSSELPRSKTPISDAPGDEPAASGPYSNASAAGTGAHTATGRAASDSTSPATARTATGPVVARTMTPAPPTVGRAPTASRTTTGQPATGRTPTSEPTVARTKSGRPVGSPAVARTSTARKTQALIAARLILVEQNADYFTLLGVPFDAPIDVVQTTYLNLVRQLHPDKLDELGVPDAMGQAQRLFHQIGVAFTVLTDPLRRSEYMVKVARPPDTSSRTRTADDIPAGPAGDAFRRGESALRRDIPADAVIEFARACALEPNNVDFHAMLGWAQFCAARDKPTIAPETRKALERAVQKSAKPTQAHFLLGRVERMLGRDKEALRHFQEVIEATPSHQEASAEIRAIEARLARASKR